jgi:hypothetical protein
MDQKLPHGSKASQKADFSASKGRGKNTFFLEHFGALNVDI